MNKMKVVIIEKDSTSRKLLLDEAKDRGWAAYAPTISEMVAGVKVDRILQEQPDVVVTDVVSVHLSTDRGQSAREAIIFARQLRQQGFRGKIIFTACWPSTDKSVEGCEEVGDCYFEKPFRLNELYETIEGSTKGEK